MRSIHERNLALVSTIESVFGVDHGVEWTDIEKNISGQQVSDLYKEVGNLGSRALTSTVFWRRRPIISGDSTSARPSLTF